MKEMRHGRAGHLLKITLLVRGRAMAESGGPWLLEAGCSNQLGLFSQNQLCLHLFCIHLPCQGWAPLPRSFTPALSFPLFCPRLRPHTIVALCLKCSKPGLSTSHTSGGVFLEEASGAAVLIHQKGLCGTSSAHKTKRRLCLAFRALCDTQMCS